MSHPNPCRCFVALLLSTVAFVSPAHAAWDTNGNGVCTLPSLQVGPSLLGSRGGAWIMWSDVRAGAEDVYARWIDSTGVLAGPEIPVAVATSFQNGPVALSDGDNGAIMAWNDNRAGNYDIYAQRISNASVPQWTANGIAVTNVTGTQKLPAITGDGLNSATLPGVYLAWEDWRSGLPDIYVQHITTTGAGLWAASGIPICTAANSQTAPIITGDGVGTVGNYSGIVVAWTDFRNGSYDVYAQRVIASGVPQWTADGIDVCAQIGHQTDVRVVRSGGGYVFVWKDGRAGNGRIYAQKISTTGTKLWDIDDVQVGPTVGGIQSEPAITNTSDGGSFIVWSDTRSGVADIYAQRLDTNGAPVWNPAGVKLCGAIGAQTAPLIIASSGGAVVSWLDTRHSADGDIYAQRFEADGSIQWPTNGIPVTTAINVQSKPRMIRDAGFGAIIAWQDHRAENDDIYAMRIAPHLVVDVPTIGPRDFSLALRSPNPTRGRVRLSLHLDHASDVAVDVFDLGGRRVASVLEGRREAGDLELNWDGAGTAGAPSPAGVYVVRARAHSGIAALKVVLLR